MIKDFCGFPANSVGMVGNSDPLKDLRPGFHAFAPVSWHFRALKRGGIVVRGHDF